MHNSLKQKQFAISSPFNLNKEIINQGTLVKKISKNNYRSTGFTTSANQNLQKFHQQQNKQKKQQNQFALPNLIQKKFQIDLNNKASTFSKYQNQIIQQNLNNKHEIKLTDQELDIGNLQVNSSYGSFKLKKYILGGVQSLKKIDNKGQQQKEFLQQQKMIKQKVNANNLQQKNDRNKIFTQNMLNYQKKGNQLLQKVLSMQEQIQKYAQIEQKDIRHFNFEENAHFLLQTKSQIQQKKEESEPNIYQSYDYQQIKRMNILGKNKVKMIENIQSQIHNLENKMNQQSFAQIEVAKKQIDCNFVTYYKHKNDILKQSKSQKFSFKNRKLGKQSNNFSKLMNKNQNFINEQIILEKVEITQEGQELSSQLKNLQQQFNSYQQRSSKQLQNYKQKLNKNTLEKELLKKEIQRLKYENLQQRIFNKNKKLNRQKRRQQNTERQFTAQKKQIFKKQKFGNWNTPKTERLGINEQEFMDDIEIQDFNNLQDFKQQLSIKYVEENYKIEELNEQIRFLQQQNQILKERLDKNQQQLVNLGQSFNELNEQKTKMEDYFTKIDQSKNLQLQDLNTQITQMNNYIMQCKQQNASQNQVIQEYKNVIQEFMKEVKSLRDEITLKNIQNFQFQQQLEEAQNINKLCQQQIQRLQIQKGILKDQISNMQSKQKLRKIVQNSHQVIHKINKNYQDHCKSKKTKLINETTKTQVLSQEMNQFQLNNLKPISKICQTLNLSPRDYKIGIMTNNQLQKYNIIKENQTNLKKFKDKYQRLFQQKQKRIQELQENLQRLKNSINYKVQQQVNQGIRTFLRYRKNTNHLVHDTIKICILPKKNLFQSKQAQKFDLKFSSIKIQNNKHKMLTCRSNLPDKNIHLTFRKILDSKFSLYSKSVHQNQNKNLQEKQFYLKIKLCIYLLSQYETNLTGSTKSIKGSNKKLPNLYPEDILMIEVGKSKLDESRKVDDKKVSIIEQRLQRLWQKMDDYELKYERERGKQQREDVKEKSLIYLSPEVLLSMNESQHSYCWTLGVIIDQILNKRVFYHRIQEIVSRNDNYKFQYQSYCSDQNCHKIKLVLQKMLKKNFKQRPSLSQVKQILNSIISNS